MMRKLSKKIFKVPEYIERQKLTNHMPKVLGLILLHGHRACRGALALTMALLLAACGDSGTTENITNNYTSGMEIADKVSDLPKCTTDNAGNQYLVKEDGEFYACNGKDWKILGGSATATDFSCETKNLADGSGVVIYCAGDSIGVVLNGKDGSNGKDGAKGDVGEKGEAGEQGPQGEAGVGCNIVAQTEEFVTIQCGDDRFSMNLNGDSGEVISPSEEAVSLETLQGVSQKGPFIKGSSVTAYELMGNKALTQTGRSFGGEITADDGRFSISNVSLTSTYVRLEANGYYRNEVSGKNSSSTIKLYAYTDLGDRSKVNVNLLTHLEYFRVREVMAVGDGSLKIKDAKKQAQKEIFAAFGIDNEGFGYSEDMDIFSEGDQNAALLAISVLLQGDRDEADLTALLTEFGQDIAEDGTWDDKATRGTIAKWAADMDLKRHEKYTLDSIRNHVDGWKLGNVPDFEKYLRNFWNQEYGLGVCGSDTVPVGTVKNAANNNGEAKSDYAATYTSQTSKVRFVCDASTKLWRAATDLEKDTYLWDAGEDGEIKLGSVTQSQYYVFDKKQGAWRKATSQFDYAYGIDGCTETREGEYVRSNVSESVYFCSNKIWSETSEFINDIYGLEDACSKSADAKKTTYGYFNMQNFYVCQGESGWKLGKRVTLNKEIFVDDRDFQVYYLVKIGEQTWMAENLNYDYNVGTAGSFCNNNDESNCDTYGRLYDWAAAMDSEAIFSDAGMGCRNGKTCNVSGNVRGVCPEGWHLPSKDEWETLITATGGENFAGDALRTITSGGTDAYGFSALPPSHFGGDYVGFWSSTAVYNRDGIYYLHLHYGPYAIVLEGSGAKYVRCLKD